MLKPKGFINTGIRNKGIMWEHLTAVSYKDLKLPISKFRLTKLLDYGVGQANQHCLYKEEIDETTSIAIDEINSKLYTPGFFEEIRDYYMQPLSDLKSAVGASLLSKLSNKELIKLYDLFYFTAGRTYPPMLLTFLSTYLDDFYTKELKKVVKADEAEVNMIKATLLTMPKLSFAEKEEFAISKILSAIKKDKNFDRKKALSEITRNFGWFHMEYAGKPLLESHYLQLIEERLRTDIFIDPIVAKKEVLKKQKEFFIKYADKRSEYITKVLQEFAFILDDSKVVTVENHYTIYPVLKEISKRLSIDLSDVYYLTQPELQEIFKGEALDKELIAERKKIRVVLLNDGVIQVFSGLKAKKLADEYVYTDDIKLNELVKGLVAYPGYYKGKVCVISSSDDKDKFNKGDVCVTHDGSAELNYFLQRAGAIITDQGGIISHTAIVARESKIPAILGTKISTKVFKDGDLVEVDAEKGTIKIIERSK